MQRDGGPGGAGGGLGSGGSFTGPATAIEIIGDHAYCFPGSIEALGTGNNDTVGMTFTTGNYYTVCEVSWTSKSTSTSVDESVEMSMNGAVIFSAVATTDEVATSQSPVQLIIPAYTEFLFKFGFATATLEMSPVLTGRIYRG